MASATGEVNVLSQSEDDAQAWLDAISRAEEAQFKKRCLEILERDKRIKLEQIALRKTWRPEFGLSQPMTYERTAT